MSVVPNGLAVSRPAVLRVLRQAEQHFWGWSVEFRGTREDLLAAGIASPEMFDLPACGKRSGTDEYGDRFEARRRAGGIFDLTRWFGADLAQGPYGNGRGWKALRKPVQAEVDCALTRMRAPRRPQP